MDLIDRQAAIDALEEDKEMINAGLDSLTLDYNTRRNQEQRREQINDDIETIKDLPSVQRTGRWETAMLDHEAFGVRPKVLYCSECNQCIAYPTRYCPNCGAYMRGENDE